LKNSYYPSKRGLRYISTITVLFFFCFFCFSQDALANRLKYELYDDQGNELVSLSENQDTSRVKVVAYVPNWNNLVSFAEKIDYSKLTHINIAFESADNMGNLTFSSGNAILIEKAHENGVKVLVSLAGGAESENYTARMKYFRLISDSLRAGFVQKIMDYVISNDLDGMDIDLEGPAINSDYGKFIRDLSVVFKPAGKLVTAALSEGYGGMDVPDSVFQFFDFINIMAYNYSGPWAPNWPGPHSSYSQALGQLNYWKNRGLPKEKAILGVPFYGYGFGDAFSYSGYKYSSIVNMYPGAEYSDQAGNTIYYNGIPTIKKKTQLVMQEAGGIMIWELSLDASGPKSLLLAIDQVLRGETTYVANSFDKESNLNIYPNPAAYNTCINYSLSSDSNTNLSIYGMQGQLIKTIDENGHKPAGNYSIILDVSEFAPGLYIICLTRGQTIESKKLIIQK